MQVRKYQITSGKIKERLQILFLADVHANGRTTNMDETILHAQGDVPDLILLGGDIINGRRAEDHTAALDFLSSLRELAPVYLVNGNHETYFRTHATAEENPYCAYVLAIKERGIHLINNRSEELQIGRNELCIAGLELPLSVYRKFTRPQVSPAVLKKQLGTIDQKRYTILLTHNPRFFSAYHSWGADLTLAGHVHGGLYRFGKHERALFDPYGFPLPAYGYGQYKVGEQQMIVTAGLGDHALKMRIRNPHEIVRITLDKEV